MSLRLKKTKIIATIGPACDAPPVLEQMIRAGMSASAPEFLARDLRRARRAH